MTRLSSLARLLLLLFPFALGLPRDASAAGWKSIDRSELIERSRFIGVGTITVYDNSPGDWVPARIDFEETIYSGVGEVERYELKVGKEDVPGTRKSWRNGDRAVWFILDDGDTYEPINHPACREDESEAEAIANEVNEDAEKDYDEAQADAEASSETEYGSGSDTSDYAESVDAYRRMAEAALTLSRPPYQDPARQSAAAWQRMNQMLRTAGIQSPFPSDLTGPANQQRFFEQAKGMIGPAGAMFSKLPAQGDPGRAPVMQAMQMNTANIVTELMGATLGAQNPAQSLQNMQPIPLQMPQGSPMASSGRTPSFRIPQSALNQIPTGGSRKNMFSGALDGMVQGGGPTPPTAPSTPRPTPGPRMPGPGAPGPRGPGR